MEMVEVSDERGVRFCSKEREVYEEEKREAPIG